MEDGQKLGDDHLDLHSFLTQGQRLPAERMAYMIRNIRAFFWCSKRPLERLCDAVQVEDAVVELHERRRLSQVIGSPDLIVEAEVNIAVMLLPQLSPTSEA